MAQTLVVARKQVEGVAPDLLAGNGIPKRGTKDHMAVWCHDDDPAR